MSIRSSAIAQGQGLLDHMDSVTHILSKKRKEQAKAKLRFKKSEENLAIMTRDGTIQLMSNEVLAQGVKEQPEAWQQWYIDRELEKDELWVAAYTEYSDAQAELYTLEVDLIDLSEQLGTSKSQSRLLSSMLLIMAEDTDGSV